MRTNLIKKKEVPKVEKKSVGGMLDMVIAFDTTGSMSSYIEAVRNHVIDLIPKLFAANPKLKVSIVAFGDYCDMKSKSDFGNAYQVIDLTDNEDKLIRFVKKARNTHGGDEDEFYELVLKKIIEETSWREGSTKSVLLIADANPHGIGYSFGNIIINNQIDWRKEANKAAAKGIKIDTMQCSNIRWYKELSKMTNGINLPFKTDSKTYQVIEAASYARGGESTRGLFKATMDSALASGDTEISAVYAAYSKELV
nr:MAG TPA: hypothetical protein [Crassvirales sp.]